MSLYGVDGRWPFAEGGGPTIGVVTGLWVTSFLFWRRRRGKATALLLAASTTLWLLILYFFRDPNRAVQQQPGMVISPGDGEIVAIVREHEPDFLQQDVLRLSIFLSIFDVHVQRIPLGGQVQEVVYRPGKFMQAFRPEASRENEAITTHIDTPYGPIVVRQIAGIMARRCVNYLQEGELVETGERFGLIRFGSRVDLFLPATAQILTTIGSKVQGGLTPVAQLGNQAD